MVGQQNPMLLPFKWVSSLVEFWNMVIFTFKDFTKKIEFSRESFLLWQVAPCWNEISNSDMALKK